VDPASQSWALIVGWAAAITFMLFGAGIMFSNSSNIERPTVVGAITMAGGLVDAFLMWRTQISDGPDSWAQVFGYVLIALLFYGWGRLVDYLLGPVKLDREADEETMGAHLSD
jgi:hypothetical protein